MSSSASPARIPPETTLPARTEQPQVLPFAYSEVKRPADGSNPSPAGGGGAGIAAVDPSTLAASVAVREAQVRESGRQQGEAEMRVKLADQLTRERSGVAKAVADFAQDRARYYQRLEEETVRLALSIARKILHREAQVDPLLLMGIVRVALERIEGATEVALVVNPQQAAGWRQQLTSMMPPGKLPEVVEDRAMAIDQCGFRTSMGTAEIGLEVQLKEIELGLTDLLAARPKN